ncbi:hypothetical protein EG344_05065 [Chryseobacterium sp. G0162]|uniref:hypothetical protein n=1 Tax=unclassified Chryseobacterium TaxID=2593645 RepID=UPI000F507F24|nr:MULTISPECIES: hypothetical protein [unclassified Chryseobacterium]AZB08274.1 hypothetical protein EG344_05065 [Chryseobacterium sp. G0162]
MKTQHIKKLSREEKLSIIAGNTKLNEEGTNGGGTNNGSGSGNILNPCLDKITKCLSYNKCKQEYVTQC